MQDKDEQPAADVSGLQIDEVTLRDLGETLARLSRDLRDISDLAIAEKRRNYLAELDRVGADLTEEDEARLDRERSDDFRRILTGLRAFRRDYDYWERVIAEYALTRMNLTQRDAALQLGVGLSTINRWAQHPLRVRDAR